MIREQFPAITLATQGTLDVARFAGWSGDIFLRPDGRAFINNNPGASLVGALPLIVARPVLDQVERWNSRSPSRASLRSTAELGAAAPAQFRERREWYILAVAFLTAAFAMAPISALTVTMLARSLAVSGAPTGGAILAAISFGFATPVFVRTGYLNHNLLVCHAGLLAGLLLWNGGSQRRSDLRILAAGALAGFAVLCDYSGILVLGTGGLYAWLRAGDVTSSARERLRGVSPYVLGAAPFLLGLGAYQWWAFGASTLPSQHFMPAIEETRRGYRGMDWPSLDIAVMNFFDPRFGLFAVCPLLILSFAAPFVRQARRRVPHREMWLMFLFFGAFTLFCAANQYSRLQWNTGIRYLVPTIPWLTLLSLQVLQVVPRPIRDAVLGGSVALVGLQAITHRPPGDVWRHPSDVQFSWIRRIGEYEGISHPGLLTLGLLLATAAILALIWRRAGRGAPSVATTGGTGTPG